MNERIRRNTPALVEQTLAGYGAWDAVSFLLTSHRLRQSAYESWRMGKIASLDDEIVGNPKRMLEMLEAALAHAECMGLVSEPASWTGWGKQAGQALRLFRDDELNARFHIRMSPKADRPQLDLFMDAPHIILLNRLRQALLNRSPAADALFDRALDEIANEPALARLDAIRAAMNTTAMEDPVAWFSYLNDVIAPAAREEFTYRSLDIMAPLWRTAAAAMARIPFDPERPELHASHAWLLAHAWEQCLASVERIPQWYEHARLHERRIACLSAMHEHVAEREAWMMYCWFCPDAAAASLDCAAGQDHALPGSDLHACGLHTLWQQFSQLEEAQSVEDFPAFTALRFGKPEAHPPVFDLARHTQGWRHYQLMTELLNRERHGEIDIALRSVLKASSPWLLQAFIAARCRSFHG